MIHLHYGLLKSNYKQWVRPVSFVLEWLWQWVVEWEKQDAEKQLEQHTTHTIKNGRVFTRIIMGEGERVS